MTSLRAHLRGSFGLLVALGAVAWLLMAGCPPKETRRDEPPKSGEPAADAGSPGETDAPGAPEPADAGAAAADAGQTAADAAPTPPDAGPAVADAAAADARKPWSRGESTLTLDNPKGPVRFPHRSHQSDYSCRRCHHDHPKGAEGKAFAPAACHTCHGVIAEAPDAKTALHKSCRGCHASEGGGPQGCSSCHRKPKP